MEFIDRIERLEKCLEEIDEGYIEISKAMFLKESDFYFSTEDLKKCVRNEITYLENKVKEKLYNKIREEIE